MTLTEEADKIKAYLENAALGVTKETYLEMCASLGNEPDPSEVPPDFEDLLEITQITFGIYTRLQDRWDGFSGFYLGKSYDNLLLLLKIYDIEPVEEVDIILRFLAIIDNHNIKSINKKLERKHASTKSSSIPSNRIR